MKNSFVERLPPVLLENNRFKELFEAIDEYWERSVTPSLQRLRDLRSVFTASSEDLDFMLQDLSAYFDSISEEISKPLSIYWKKQEVANKNSLNAFDSLLQRISIKTKDVEFVSLYSPIDTDTYPYGSVFYTKQEIDESSDLDSSNFFLTSHVRFNISSDLVLEKGIDRIELMEVLGRYFEENVRPAHIVFDGVNYFLMVKEITHNISIGIQINRITVCKEIV